MGIKLSCTHIIRLIQDLGLKALTFFVFKLKSTVSDSMYRFASNHLTWNSRQLLQIERGWWLSFT
jgi:hypothetical protein